MLRKKIDIKQTKTFVAGKYEYIIHDSPRSQVAFVENQARTSLTVLALDYGDLVLTLNKIDNICDQNDINWSGKIHKIKLITGGLKLGLNLSAAEVQKIEMNKLNLVYMFCSTFINRRDCKEWNETEAKEDVDIWKKHCVPDGFFFYAVQRLKGFMEFYIKHLEIAKTATKKTS